MPFVSFPHPLEIYLQRTLEGCPIPFAAFLSLPRPFYHVGCSSNISESQDVSQIRSNVVSLIVLEVMQCAGALFYFSVKSFTSQKFRGRKVSLTPPPKRNTPHAQVFYFSNKFDPGSLIPSRQASCDKQFAGSHRA